MTEQIRGYILLGIIIALAILAISIGVQKMIKIIFGNYILSTIALVAGQSLEIFSKFLLQSPDATFAKISYVSLANFIGGAKTIIVLILYVLLLFIIYKKSTIKITLPHDEVLQKTFYVFLVPLTVLSIVIALQIVVMGIDVINFGALDTFASGLTSPGSYLYTFITLMPVWILSHGIATIIISSELRVTIETEPDLDL